MNIPDPLLALVDVVLRDVDYGENPYFRALRDGSFAREDFLETQYQFYHAVTFFSRPMAALVARIPSAELRVEILRNVWEEHGEGDRGRMHGSTFIELLGRLSGLEAEGTMAELARRPVWPELRGFNTLLIGACVLDDYLIGTGVLGIIERMFAEISGWIGRALVDRGFVPEDRMVHYDLHEKLDVRHAADFFAVLGHAWTEDPSSHADIEQGLRMGAIAFDQLYARLYRVRSRRWVKGA